MHASNYHIRTLKEAPAEAEIVSHQLMTRAGMIRRVAGGIYTYMPLGLKVLRKIEAIVRDEMNRAGAIELLMPFIQPDRKSTRLNSSHVSISYAVFCLRETNTKTRVD